MWSRCRGTLWMCTHTGHCGRTPTAAAERSPLEFKNQPQLSAMRKMLDSIVLQNKDLFLGPISPSAGLRRSETARNAVPVHACDWIASQRYWISSGFPVGTGPRSQERPTWVVWGGGAQYRHECRSKRGLIICWSVMGGGRRNRTVEAGGGAGKRWAGLRPRPPVFWSHLRVRWRGRYLLPWYEQPLQTTHMTVLALGGSPLW